MARIYLLNEKQDAFQRIDTRFCCDQLCQQGRHCPADETELAGYLPPDPTRVIYEQRPKARVPRSDKASPIAVIVVGILALLAAMAVVSSALQVSL